MGNRHTQQAKTKAHEEFRKFQAIQDASFKNYFERGLDEGGFK